MQAHMGTQNEEVSRDSWECSICGQTFFSEPNLKTHSLVAHAHKNGGKGFECSACGKWFRAKGALKTHVVGQHSEGKPWACSICGAEFTQKGSLKRHVVAKHSECKPLECSTCGKTLASKRLLKEHMPIHSGTRSTICGKVLAQRHLKPPMLIHGPSNSFPCSICGKTFALQGSLRKHMLIVACEKKEPNIECSTCGIELATEMMLKEHMSTHGDRPWKCSTCGRRFALQYKLKQHMALGHIRLNAYGCPTCGKTFASEPYLRRHMERHGGPPKPKATGLGVSTICGTSCLTGRSLHGHMVTHGGVESFGCSTCGETFASQSILDEHIHGSEVKLFECSTEGNNFISEPNRVTQDRIKASGCSTEGAQDVKPDISSIHLPVVVKDLARSADIDVKPDINIISVASSISKSNSTLHRCPLCCEQFVSRSQLDNHLEGHSDHSDFRCEPCNSGFINKSTYIMHVQVSHNYILGL